MCMLSRWSNTNKNISIIEYTKFLVLENFIFDNLGMLWLYSIPNGKSPKLLPYQNFQITLLSSQYKLTHVQPKS